MGDNRAGAARGGRLGGQPALDIVEGEQWHDLDRGVERGKKRLENARQDRRIGGIENEEAAALPVDQREIGRFRFVALTRSSIAVPRVPSFAAALPRSTGRSASASWRLRFHYTGG